MAKTKMCLELCFFFTLHKYTQVKKINHKSLFKGHTHMEADNVHGLIERKRKQMTAITVLTPAIGKNL